MKTLSIALFALLATSTACSDSLVVDSDIDEESSENDPEEVRMAVDDELRGLGFTDEELAAGFPDEDQVGLVSFDLEDEDKALEDLGLEAEDPEVVGDEPTWQLPFDDEEAIAEFEAEEPVTEELFDDIDPTAELTEAADLERSSRRRCRWTNGWYHGNHRDLNWKQAAAAAHKGGVRCGPRLVKAVAVAAAESALWQYRWARNTNCSVDRGLWQINSIHGWRSSFNLLTNARAMYRISGHGKHWGAWYAYGNEYYRKYLRPACRKGVRKICGEDTRCR